MKEFVEAQLTRHALDVRGNASQLEHHSSGGFPEARAGESRLVFLVLSTKKRQTKISNRYAYVIHLNAVGKIGKMVTLL